MEAPQKAVVYTPESVTAINMLASVIFRKLSLEAINVAANEGRMLVSKGDIRAALQKTLEAMPQLAEQTMRVAVPRIVELEQKLWGLKRAYAFRHKPLLLIMSRAGLEPGTT